MMPMFKVCVVTQVTKLGISVLTVVEFITVVTATKKALCDSCRMTYSKLL